jgi:hypothetical protein
MKNILSLFVGQSPLTASLDEALFSSSATSASFPKHTDSYQEKHANRLLTPGSNAEPWSLLPTA